MEELGSTEVVVTELVIVEVLVTVLMTVFDAEVELVEVVEGLAIVEVADVDVEGPFCEVLDVVKVEDDGEAGVLADMTDVPADEDDEESRLLVTLVDARPELTAFEVVVEMLVVEENANDVDAVVIMTVEVVDVDVELCSTEVCTAVLD